MIGKGKYILHKDIVGSWFDGYAVVAALVYHVRQLYVVGVHGIETICVLHPVGSVRGIYGSCVIEDVVKPHIGSVHDVQGPKRRVLHIDYDIELRVRTRNM